MTQEVYCLTCFTWYPYGAAVCPNCKDHAKQMLEEFKNDVAASALRDPFVVLKGLREAGWAVACHNDYKLHKQNWTFWLFTKGNYAVKGEGITDLDALEEVECCIDILKLGNKDVR